MLYDTQCAMLNAYVPAVTSFFQILSASASSIPWLWAPSRNWPYSRLNAASPFFCEITLRISAAWTQGNLPTFRHKARIRSEEHTSELQSLMRISYAVFCLKQKKQTRRITSKQHR